MSVARCFAFAVAGFCLVPGVAGAAPSKKQDADGRIDVWALREAVAKLETGEVLPDEDSDFCRQDLRCQRKHERARQRYLVARDAFMRTWGRALLQSIERGDEVAEVIWRNCDTTSVIDRAALASTCDPDETRRAEARRRLQAIGFEAAIPEEASGPVSRVPDRRAPARAAQARLIAGMKAGIVRTDLGAYIGGNMAATPAELDDYRRAMAIEAATQLMQRAFVFRRFGGTYFTAPHAIGTLRLNRIPVGAPAIAWGSYVMAGNLRLGGLDPFRNELHEIYLGYPYDPNDSYLAGNPTDTVYLRTVLDILQSSEARIDAWLARDPRWAVFLLHRRGHHEWIPEGRPSTFGRLTTPWEGGWRLAARFVDLDPAPVPKGIDAWIGRRGDVTVLRTGSGQATKTGTSSCELRYSGARTDPQRRDEPIEHSAFGRLSALRHRLDTHSGSLPEALAPLATGRRYRQVVVGCPDSEWPGKGGVHTLVLAGNTLVEARSTHEAPWKIVIQHWRRAAVSPALASWTAPPRQDQGPLLAALRTQLATAEALDAAAAERKVRQDAFLARVEEAGTAELLDSLSLLRIERLWYSLETLPRNVVRLVDTPGVAGAVSDAYRRHPADPLHRFNLIVVLTRLSKLGRLTPAERPVVGAVLREAISDPHPRVRAEALYQFGLFAGPSDRPAIEALRKDADEDVRMQASNALLRLAEREGLPAR